MNKDILKWVLILGGAYLVYRYLEQNGYLLALTGGQGAGAGTGTDTGVINTRGTADGGGTATGTGTGAGTGTGTGAGTGTSLPSLRSRLDELTRTNAYRVTQGGNLTWHQWNFFYKQVSGGVDAYDPASLGLPSDTPISLDEFLGHAAKVSGFSGLYAMRPGLGWGGSGGGWGWTN